MELAPHAGEKQKNVVPEQEGRSENQDRKSQSPQGAIFRTKPRVAHAHRHTSTACGRRRIQSSWLEKQNLTPSVKPSSKEKVLRIVRS